MSKHFYRFNRDDGWAIASHIALSILMAVFPFLIVVTALAGFIGSVNLADEVARLMFAAWPQEVAGPLASEIHNVLTTSARRRADARRRVCGLFRLERRREPAHRAQSRLRAAANSEAFGCCGWNRSAMCWSAPSRLLALAFLVVLGPLIFKTAAELRALARAARSPLRFRAFRHRRPGARAGACSFCICGCRPDGADSDTVWPGIVATLVLWLACGFTFGHYLADFAYTYVNYYAGLASAMIALVFLYYSAWIFVYGGELNAAIARVREGKS